MTWLILLGPRMRTWKKIKETIEWDYLLRIENDMYRSTIKHCEKYWIWIAYSSKKQAIRMNYTWQYILFSDVLCKTMRSIDYIWIWQMINIVATGVFSGILCSDLYSYIQKRYVYRVRCKCMKSTQHSAKNGNVWTRI